MNEKFTHKVIPVMVKQCISYIIIVMSHEGYDGWYHLPWCLFCSGFDMLTHLPLDKMAAILADDIFKCIFLNENVRMSIQISLKFVPKGSNWQ